MRKITFLLTLLFTFVGVMPSMAELVDMELDESKVYTIKFTDLSDNTHYLYSTGSIVTWDNSKLFDPNNIDDSFLFRFKKAQNTASNSTLSSHKAYYIQSVNDNNYIYYRSETQTALMAVDDSKLLTTQTVRWVVQQEGEVNKIFSAQYGGGSYFITTYAWWPAGSGETLGLSKTASRDLIIEVVSNYEPGGGEEGGNEGGGESGGGESEESDTKNAPTNVTVSQAPTANGWDVNTKFYTIKNGNNNFLNGDVVKSGTNYLSLTSGSTPDESGYWCVTGNDTDGYSFYNYETGKILAMTANTAYESNAFAWLEDANAASGYNTKFTFTKSKKGGDYWCIKVKDSENSYWTQHGNENFNSFNCLSYWNSEEAVNGWQNSGTGDNGSAFIFAAVDVNLPLNVNLAEITADDQLLSNMEGRIGTFSAPYATTIPSGVTAYYAQPSEVNGTDVISLKALGEGVVPANFGVLLVGSAERVTMNPNKTSVEVPENAFSHSAGADVTLPENSYILVRGDLGIGFYPAKVGSTLKANKTYLNLGTSNVSAFKLMVDEVTAIESVVTGKTNSAIYDLSGRRVLNTVKGGIYIQNGKKFIVK